MKSDKSLILFNTKMLKEAIRDSVIKLNPLTLWRNPVMLIVEVGAVITTIYSLIELKSGTGHYFSLQVSLWLWFTVLFANFAEALAEIRGKGRAQSLRETQTELTANRQKLDGKYETVSSIQLRKGDTILVKEGEIISGDGDILSGTALVDESAITGESAPVIRESGGDRTSVTGGTRILSGEILVKVTSNPGDTFLDQMIKMVESASRQKTPNEVALEILLIGLTILFLVVIITLPVFAGYMSVKTTITVLISLLVCLMPTTIGGLLPAIGIAGMDRLIQHNVIALSGRAVEAAGDVNVVLLDKTGTITLGNRMADELILAEGISRDTLVESALLSSLPDETPEGRSIVTLCKTEKGIKGKDIRTPRDAAFIAFTPQTRMSGVRIGSRVIMKGSYDAIEEMILASQNRMPDDIHAKADEVARQGDTPLVVADNERVLGIIRLKDIVKQGIKGRLKQLREMGIKSVMITGDNPLTAASIAAEAGLDDFIAQAKPETKLSLIRKYQENGNLVAMIGDGTNDAPALAQADVAVAMNAGTQAAREAANMIDLDSNPTKLLDIVETGKQILITRGALTTFSISNDVAKYFAIIPALFAAQYPELNILNIMHLTNPASAVLSAVIFNALIIPLLIPIALQGVRMKSASASAILKTNLLIYGFGGLLLPFLGIKIIDIFLKLAGLV